MIMCVFEAHNGRDVVTIDVANAFIQTRVDNADQGQPIKVKGILFDRLLEISPEVYADYVDIDQNGQKVRILDFSMLCTVP